MKNQKFGRIIHRDGDKCFFCPIPFVNRIKAKLTNQEDYIREWDHLNNDETDNREENLVHAHRKCNRNKKFNAEMQVKATEKLKENERLAEIPQAHSKTDKETTAETDTNAVFINIAKSYLEEMLLSHSGRPSIEDNLNLKETADILAGKGIKKCGHGSPITFRRIIDVMCSGEFSFEKYKEDGVWYIRLRYDEEME